MHNIEHVGLCEYTHGHMPCTHHCWRRVTVSSPAQCQRGIMTKLATKRACRQLQPFSSLGPSIFARPPRCGLLAGTSKLDNRT